MYTYEKACHVPYPTPSVNQSVHGIMVSIVWCQMTTLSEPALTKFTLEGFFTRMHTEMDFHLWFKLVLSSTRVTNQKLIVVLVDDFWKQNKLHTDIGISTTVLQVTVVKHLNWPYNTTEFEQLLNIHDTM